MKRREILKLSLLTLFSSVAMAFDKSKIVDDVTHTKEDPENPTSFEQKHTPEITILDDDTTDEYLMVEVTVGEDGIIHPSTEDHWIYKIELYADEQKVGYVELEPSSSRGFFVTQVQKEGLKELKAIASCNLHGNWENSKIITQA